MRYPATIRVIQPIQPMARWRGVVREFLLRTYWPETIGKIGAMRYPYRAVILRRTNTADCGLVWFGRMDVIRYPLDIPTMFKAANRTCYVRPVLLWRSGQLRCAWFPAYSSSLRLSRRQRADR